MWCRSKSAAVWGTPAVALTHPGRQPVTHKRPAQNEERPGILNQDSRASKLIVNRCSVRAAAARERDLARIPGDRRNAHQLLLAIENWSKV